MFASVREFWQLTIPFRGQLIVLVFFLSVDALLTALSVVTIAPLADLALERSPEEWLPVTVTFEAALNTLGIPFSIASLAVVFFLLTLSMALFSVYVRYLLVRLRVAVIGRLVSESLDKIFNASWGYFATSSSGKLINTYVSEVNKSGSAFQGLTMASANLVRVAAFVVVPFLLEPVLVTVCLLSAIALIFPFMYLGRWSTKFGARDLQFSNRFSSLLKEALSAAREVISFSREQRTRDQINDSYRQYADSRVKSETFAYFSSQMFEPLGILVILGVLVIAKEYSEALALSSIAAVLWGLVRTLGPLKQLINLKHGIDNKLPSLRQILDDQAKADQYRQSKGGVEYTTEIASVSLRNVNFRYESGEPALSDVSLEASAGQMIALVGESGSGKSTIVDLLLGLQQPESGTVLLNGVDSRAIDLGQWRSGLSVVPQKPVLFDLTVRENLLWANPDADEASMRHALEVTESAEFVDQLPNGLDTEVGDAGIRLSGGQIQRLALARALIREPSVLILDEATSALDTETESRIYGALPAATRDCLLIVVAHRLATVRSADRILVFRKGKLEEQGSYDQLNLAGGYFHRLVHSRPESSDSEHAKKTSTLVATSQ